MMNKLEGKVSSDFTYVLKKLKCYKRKTETDVCETFIRKKMFNVLVYLTF